MASKVVVVQSASEWASHLNANKSFGGGNAVIVDFSAEWCGPCKMIGPIFASLSNEYPGVTFLKVDVDQLPDVAKECGITAMPTFQAYFNGAKTDELRGADKAKLKAMIEALAAQGQAAGPGRVLGGGSSVGVVYDDSPQARRERALAAAEARSAAVQPS